MKNVQFGNPSCHLTSVSALDALVTIVAESMGGIVASHSHDSEFMLRKTKEGLRPTITDGQWGYGIPIAHCWHKEKSKELLWGEGRERESHPKPVT